MSVNNLTQRRAAHGDGSDASGSGEPVPFSSSASDADGMTGGASNGDGVGDVYAPKLTVTFEEEQGLKDYLVTKTSKGARKMKLQWAQRAKSYSLLDWVGIFLPCVHWLKAYKWRTDLMSDVLAGLSVGAMVVPQGMSYANLAGLPSVYGLYGAFVPVWVYSALGSSRQLAVGPVAVTSLLLFSGINDGIFKNPNDNYNEPADPDAQQQYNEIAIQVAFVAGCLYTALGLLRLGWFTNFLSHAVISGFTFGAAIIIGLSQMKYVLGYTRWYKDDVAPICDADACVCPDSLNYASSTRQCYESFPRSDAVYTSVYNLFAWVTQFQWREFLMAASWLVILVSFKECGKRFRKLRILRALGPLTVLVLGLAITNIFRLYEPPSNISVVGEIDGGLPAFTAGWITAGFYDFSAIAWLAVLICLIDVMESTAIATTLALKNRYQLNYTQELRGLGFANIAGSLFNCYTTTGSFSRSAVNNDVGAKTPLAQFISASLVLLVLVLITPAFTNLPQNVMGAVVLSAVFGLIDVHAPVFFWRVNKTDFLVWIVAASCTTMISVKAGLLVSIGLSLFLILLRVAFPHTAELGRLPGTLVYRNLKQYPEATRMDGMVVARIDAPLYFANLRPIRDRLDKYERSAEQRAAEKGVPLRYMIIDMSPVTGIDGTAVHWLENLISDHVQRGLVVVLSNPSREVSAQMVRANLPPKVGADNIFVRVHDAVESCAQRIADTQRAEKEEAAV